jgi:hypothetical protein
MFRMFSVTTFAIGFGPPHACRTDEAMSDKLRYKFMRSAVDDKMK